MDIRELSEYLPHQHRTGAKNGKGIRPEADTGNILRGDKLSLHLMRNHGEEVSVSNLILAQGHPLLRIWRFLVLSVTVLVGHGSGVKQRQKNLALALVAVSRSFILIKQERAIAIAS